jgi:hypothetical protein
MDGILEWGFKVGVAILLLGVSALAIGVFVWVIRVWLVLPIIKIANRAWEERDALSPLSSGGRYRIFGVIVIITSIVAFIWTNYYDRATLLSIAALSFGYIAWRCFDYARRFDARRAEDVVASDSRPPVLYLRSFEDDRRVAGNINVDGLHVETEESELAKLFRSLGPFLAVGRPQEMLSYAGAARFQFDNDDWQQHVIELLSVARLVLIRAGKSDGLLWEIQTVVRLVEPEKILLLIPWGRRSYDKFRSAVGGVFPAGLPTYAGKNPKECFLAGIVFFDNDWTPHFSASSSRHFFEQLVDDFTTNFLLRTKSTERRGLDHALPPVVGRWEKVGAMEE